MRKYAIVKYEVVYYDPENGRQIWWPADEDLRFALMQLVSARNNGKENARLNLVS